VILNVWLPLVITGLLAVFAAPLARRLPPKVTALTLTAVAATATASVLVSLVLIAATAVGRIPLFARYGDWSASAFATHSPPPLATGCVCAVLAPVALALTLRGLRDRVRSLWSVERILRADPARVVVVSDAAPIAFAAGGLRGGQITVSTGMLAALGPEERHALLAHEAAHLRLGHHWLRLMTGLAAAGNPLLRHLPALVEQACEEWADADAAARTGSREVVARAVVRAALASHHHGTGAGVGGAVAAAATGASVPVRVHNLLEPPRSSVLGRWVLMAASIMILISVEATLDAGHDCAEIFQLAHRAFEHGLLAHLHSASGARSSGQAAPVLLTTR
jgi:hypothetical protein